MTSLAIAEPPHPHPAGRAGGRADAEECARRLMSRLHALGLRASGPWESGSSPMAVSAQCVQVEPYVGRTVWLLPPPGGPSGEPADGDDLYWHWQRPRRDRAGHPVARWFQPFCPAADPERAATAISEAILADLRRRDR